MQEETKRAQMQDVLEQIGYTDGGGRAVVEDRNSRTAGPDAGSASVIKILLDSFDAKLKSVGLELVNACVHWGTDESPEQVFDKLRQIDLIPGQLRLD